MTGVAISPKTRTLGALLALALLPACGLFQTVFDAPDAVARAVRSKKPEDSLQPLETLHPRLLGMADACVVRIRMATEMFADEIGTPQAQIQATTWRIQAARAIYQAATGPSPISGLLDTIVVVSTAKVLFERRQIAEKWGPACRHIQAALVADDLRVWEVANDYLTPAQIADFRQSIADWAAKGSQREADEFDELPDFRQMAHLVAKSGSTSGGSIMGFLSIDPLAGLEPAAREVALTRQYAERMLFWVQRLPMMVQDQIELATLNTQRLPEVIATVASLERATAAAESIAKTTEALPAQISKEREAAIEQINRAIGAQREALTKDLENAKAPVDSMLVESRRTIEAARAMSAEVTGTLQAFDAMMKRFDAAPKDPAPTTAPVPAPNPAATSPSAQPAKPFDINDYGDAATRIGGAAKELREALAQFDQSLPQVTKTLDATVARVDVVIDNAFQRGLTLGVSLMGAAGLTVLLVRWLSRRMPPR